VAELYLDPIIIVIAVIMVITVIGIFDFLPHKKDIPPNTLK
jgi:hypothetical protein